MKAKHVVLILASTGLISSQALAASAGVEGASAGSAQTTFTEADTSRLFEQAGQPMQVAALSSTEMKETEGALLPILAVAALGAVTGGITSAGVYAVRQGIRGQPVTTQGIRVAAAGGAVTGAIGGPLIGAAGGGIVGNVAWRPGLWAANSAIQNASNGVLNNR